MTKGMGYPLPSGDAEENDLQCMIVFYPNRTEYRRALMGSLDYLATWIAWERDSGKRGQDAAASWKLANIQTWECTTMGYCEDLATTLQALLAATQALECCGEQDITDGVQYTDDVIDGVGDVPQNIIDAGYASGVTDWEGFADYKCMISHLAVDHIETFFRDISPHIDAAGNVIGGIGVVGALLGAILVVVGLPISLGIVAAVGASAAIWKWISSYGADAVDDLADEIATNHNDLVCALYYGDGVQDSIDEFNLEVDALFSAIDAVAIKAVGFEPQLRAMYGGRYNQEDVAQNLDDLGYELGDFSCVACEEYELAIEYDFTSGDLGFVDNSRANWVVAYTFWNEEDGWYLNASGILSASIYRDGEDVLADMGASISGSERFYVEHMEWDWYPGTNVQQQGKFFANGSFTPDDFDYQVQGTYSKDWASGTEPQIANDQQLGMVSPTQGGGTGPNEIAFIYRLVIAGHIAEAS